MWASSSRALGWRRLTGWCWRAAEAKNRFCGSGCGRGTRTSPELAGVSFLHRSSRVRATKRQFFIFIWIWRQCPQLDPGFFQYCRWHLPAPEEIAASNGRHLISPPPDIIRPTPTGTMSIAIRIHWHPLSWNSRKTYRPFSHKVWLLSIPQTQNRTTAASNLQSSLFPICITMVTLRFRVWAHHNIIVGTISWWVAAVGATSAKHPLKTLADTESHQSRGNYTYVTIYI